MSLFGILFLIPLPYTQHEKKKKNIPSTIFFNVESFHNDIPLIEKYGYGTLIVLLVFLIQEK